MSSEIRFVPLRIVEKLHAVSLENHGGSAGTRDQGGLESAVDAPKNIDVYGGGDLFEIAAGYAFHIAEAQAFVDGNKRTAIATALFFLRINEIAITGIEPMLLYDSMIEIANHQLRRGDFAKQFRELFG